MMRLILSIICVSVYTLAFGNFNIAHAETRFARAGDQVILGPYYSPSMRSRVSRKPTRTKVRYTTGERAGSVIVDTRKKYLYYVLGNGKALRYGVGVARPGFEWSGRHRVSYKAEWPSWTPPAAMRKREPHLPAFMPGGPDNPLGARALYIGRTLYRIHGTNEGHTIGRAMSSGCIRMLNADVIDLFKRVRVGASVVVKR